MSGTITNGISTGKDVAAVLVGPTGAIDLPPLTGFDDEPVYETLKSKVLNGPTRQFSLPDGHNVSLKFDRQDGAVDAFQSAIEAAYWAANGWIPLFTLYTYVTERDGSTSRFEYTELDLAYKPGSWKSGSPVAAELKGFARYKRAL